LRITLYCPSRTLDWGFPEHYGIIHASSSPKIHAELKWLKSFCILNLGKPFMLPESITLESSSKNMQLLRVFMFVWEIPLFTAFNSLKLTPGFLVSNPYICNFNTK